MNLKTIIEMQKDRSNGVLLSRISIDKLIGHALMRECELSHLHERIESLETELRSTKALLAMATKQGRNTASFRPSC